MKKRIFSCVAAVALFGTVKAQMFGTFNVPGTFPSLAAAVASLNASGVGGPVFINVAAGYTEVAPAGGFNLGVITGVSATNSVTIRKFGIGANPVLSAYVGTATPASAAQDGIFRFVGSDFITIDGIDIVDGNTTNPATMEFGYGFFNASATDGCQNNLIINCNISLRTVNNAAGSGPAVEGSRGIDMVSALSGAHTTALTITAATGNHSNNRIYSNIIQNCNVAIAMIGFNAPSPFTFANTGNDVGGASAVTSNTIINFGGGGTTSAASAIICQAQHSLNIAYNIINNNNGSGTNHNQILRGIVLNSANTAQGSISNNTITLRSAGTTQQMVAISNAAGTSTSNSLTISNNLITGCQYTTATTGVFNAIINSGTPSDLFINSNTITATNHAGTGADVIIETGSPVSAITNSNTITSFTRTGASGSVRFIKTTSPTNWTANGNLIDGAIWSTTTSSGSMSGIYSLSSAVNVTANNNIIRNIALPGSGTLEGIREFGVTGNKVIQNNQIYNFTTTAGGSAESTFLGISVSTGSVVISGNQIYSLSITGGAAGSVNGILVSGGTSSSIFKNKIYDLSSTSTGPSLIGMNITGGTTNTIFNNLIGNLNVTTATGANAVIGMNITGGTANQVYYNTVNLSATSSGANFGSSAISNATGASLELRNNIFVNNSTVSGTGLAVAFRRSSTTLTSYSATSNNNLFFAGVPASNRLIFADGTNNVQGLAAYKILVFNRDLNSITENPTYVSTVGSNANFLNIDPVVPTQIQNSGLPIAGITDDYAATSRNATTPDIGAWEGGFTSQTACSGAPASATTAATQSLACPGIPLNVWANITYTGTGISYQWQASTTGSAGVYSAVSGGTNAILVNPLLGAAQTWYQLQVTCATSGSSTISTPVLVSAGFNTLTASASAATVCSGTSVNLSLSSNPLGVNYQWQASTTSSASGFSSVSGATLATSSQTGALGSNWYQAVVSCSANNTFSFVTNPVTFSSLPVPSASAATSASSLCASGTVTLTASSNIGTSYTWSGPNAYTSSSQTPVIAGPATGNYSVIASLNGCNSAPATVSITTSGRNFTANIIASPTTVCQTGTINLSYPNQADPYTFSSATGLPLLTLTSPATVLTSSNDDTPMAAPANIGFTFNFFGTNYTQFSASPDGFITLGSGVPSAQFTNSVTSTTNIPKIYPYWDDLATGSNGYVRTALLGATPNRTFVVEWFVTVPRNTTGAANTTFQALLFETTNNIQFRYGTGGVATGNSSGGLTVSGTNFSSITFSTNSTSTVTPNDNNFVFPASGTAYNFIAPLNPTYSWSPAGLLSSTTASAVTGTVSASQIFSLDLNVQGCIASKTVQIIVDTPPSLTVAASAATLCAGSTVSLTATGANTFTWNTGATGSVAVVTPSVNGTNVYTVNATGLSCTSSRTVSVSRNAAPPLVISGPSGICPPDQATLTVTGATSYSWNTGSTTTSIVVSPTVPTQYTVTGTDAVGCSTTIARYLNVSTSLAMNGTAPSSVCAGQPANIAINGANTYSWSTGATTGTIAPTPTVTTTYSVVGTSGSCTGSIAITVSAIPFPTLAFTGNSVICAGQTASITASGASTYSWSTGTTNSFVTLTPTVNTTYSITGINGGVCATTQTLSITSNSVPVISVAQVSASTCFSTSTTFTASGANTYTWVNGPQNSLFTITPTVAAVYTVSGTNGAGCVTTRTVSMGIFSLPVIGITPSTPTLCSTTPTSFTATGANTYTWNAGAATGSNVLLSTANNTIFTVVGTDANGCVNTTTTSVSTIPVPTVVAAPSAVTVCALSFVTFTANGANSYVWSSGATTSVAAISSSASTIHSVVGTGTNGCSTTATVAVTTLSLPVIAITPSFATICAKVPTSFTASGAQTYTWSNNANTPSTVLNPSVSTQFSVSGTDAQGCTNSAQLSIITIPLPNVNVAKPASTVCANAAGNYTASGANTYTWSTGANATITAITPSATATYTVDGTDTITGCVGTKTFVINTFSAPIISVLPSLTQTVCHGATANFTLSGANTYSWSTGSFGSQLAVTPSVNSVYTVIAKSSQNCATSGTVAVNLYSLTVVNATADIDTVCAKEKVTLTGTGASTYTWLPNFVTGSTYSFSALATLQYVLNGTDANGCAGSDTIKVVVNKCTGIEINSALSNMINVYPNPSRGVFNLDMPFEGNKLVKVYSVSGALIYFAETKDQVQAMNLTGAAKGLYYIEIEAVNSTARFKVVIE